MQINVDVTDAQHAALVGKAKERGLETPAEYFLFVAEEAEREAAQRAEAERRAAVTREVSSLTPDEQAAVLEQIAQMKAARGQGGAED